MCGLFGYSLSKPLPLTKACGILERLETNQLPEETRPLGGYGAGMAVILEDGTAMIEKVGHVSACPARLLTRMVKIGEASVLLGHVRMPSPEFMRTVKFKETAQPYIVRNAPETTIISVHNGRLDNYKEIRRKLGRRHVFESEKHELIDSEVIPRFYGETLNREGDTTQALYSFFFALKGANALAILQIGDENSFLHLVHKGKTRGLTIWGNDRNEVIFSSRKTPIIEDFGKTLMKNRFHEKVSIQFHEDVGLILSLPLQSR